MNLSIDYEPIKSPLRYPGGKSRAVNIILDYIPNIDVLVSPFVGGGSIELAVAANKINVFAYDVFEPLVSFWQMLLSDKMALADLVQTYHPLSKDDFSRLQKTNLHLTDSIQQAAEFYVLNRCSFSGSTLSGGMGNGHPRFTEKSIQNIRDFNITHFKVEKSDFRDTLAKHKTEFLYLDPPYLLEKNNNLYGVNGSTHKNFAHNDLFDLLKDRQNWIMSYNNGDDILEMYKDFPQIFPEWKYGMSKDKSSNEVLIFSHNLRNLIG